MFSKHLYELECGNLCMLPDTYSKIIKAIRARGEGYHEFGMKCKIFAVVNISSRQQEILDSLLNILYNILVFIIQSLTKD